MTGFPQHLLVRNLDDSYEKLYTYVCPQGHVHYKNLTPGSNWVPEQIGQKWFVRHPDPRHPTHEVNRSMAFARNASRFTSHDVDGLEPDNPAYTDCSSTEEKASSASKGILGKRKGTK